MGWLQNIKAVAGVSNGPSLEHIKAMAASVKPEYMDELAEVFETGGASGAQSGEALGSAIDNVVTGWKGEAADAASTKTLKTSMNSQSVGESSTAYAAKARSFANTIRQHQHQIAAVEPVDTSHGAAVHAVGGQVVAFASPGAVAGAMAASRVKSEQHREKAAKYLAAMDGDGKDYPSHTGSFDTAPMKEGAYDQGALPRELHVREVSNSKQSRDDGGGYPGGSGYSGGGGSGGGNYSGGSGSGGYSGGGNGSASGGGAVGGGGALGGGHHPGAPGFGVEGTTPTSGGVPSSTTPAPLAASAGPIEPGGTNFGLAGGLAAGGGALAVAGGLAAGAGRGAFAGGRGALRPGLAEGEPNPARGAGRGAPDSFARGGAAGDAAAERGLTERGLAGRGLAGEAAESSALRSGMTSSALAGEAAGGRGFLPGGAGSGARRDDDDELDRRPDYLVASDDIWGDGRLAAPPVLG